MKKLVILMWLVGCGASAYATELQMCTDRATSWPTYRKCEADVNARYGVDAGTKDGGGK